MTNPKDSAPTREHSGLIGIIGRPNVGKSTLLNLYVGQKVSIVSPMPQTTRQKIVGVLTRQDAQAIFLDSPGLGRSNQPLGRHMAGVATSILHDADVLIVMIDGRSGITAEDERVFSRLNKSKHTAFLAINKIDVIKKPNLLPILDAASRLGVFKECIPISALTGEQTNLLLDKAIKILPEGHLWYEEGTTTDQSTEQLIRELIREQILRSTHEEVPHSVAVWIDLIEEKEKLTKIYCTILVERKGQKAIVIGKGGSMLKGIGQAARQGIEALIKKHVYLELWVKVVENWRSNTSILNELGYTEK